MMYSKVIIKVKTETNDLAIYAKIKKGVCTIYVGNKKFKKNI